MNYFLSQMASVEWSIQSTDEPEEVSSLIRENQIEGVSTKEGVKMVKLSLSAIAN